MQNKTQKNCHNVNICTVRRSSSVVSNVSTVSASTTEENLAESSVENITDQILAEASENYNENSSPELLDNDITEEEQLIREMDRDLPTTSGAASSLRHRITSVELTDEQNEEEKISIKLKYINDDIKIVNGYLNESLASFKRYYELFPRWAFNKIKIINIFCLLFILEDNSTSNWKRNL